MKRILYTMIITLGIISSIYSQEAPEGNQPAKPAESTESADDFELTSDQVYREITIENFENVKYANKDVQIRVTKEQKAGLTMRNQYPAPIRGSKNYLGVKVYGKRGDVITIIPVKPLEIKDHCQSISAWVYGKNFSGELSLIVQDAAENTHRLRMGRLNFLGWRKLTVKLRNNVAQEDKFLSQPKKLKILKILYNPGNTGRLPIWNYFYIDDITAKVRKKYEDRQNDTW